MNRKRVNRLIISASLLMIVSIVSLLSTFIFKVGVREVELLIYAQFIFAFLTSIIILINGRILLGKENRAFSSLLSTFVFSLSFYVIFITFKYRFLFFYNKNNINDLLKADLIHYLLVFMVFTAAVYILIVLINLVLYTIYSVKNKMLIKKIKRKSVTTLENIEEENLNLKLSGEELLKIKKEKK